MMPTPHEDFLAIVNGIECPIPCPHCCLSDCTYFSTRGCTLERAQRPPICRIHLCERARDALGLSDEESIERVELFYKTANVTGFERVPWSDRPFRAVRLIKGCEDPRHRRPNCDDCGADDCAARPSREEVQGALRRAREAYERRLSCQP